MRYLGQDIDFSAPPGAPALTPPTSVSWRVFKNPVTVAIGGVAAVLLELAHPLVRAGVWGHSTFREKPLRRMRRTGLAAMVTVYGPRETTEAMIAGVRRMHDRVEGVTPEGVSYRASDPALLTWVQATAAYGFVEAYSAYAHPLGEAEKSKYLSEGRTAARLYGAKGAPANRAEQAQLFAETVPVLEPSSVIGEFLDVLQRALPAPRNVLVRAAVDILPEEIRGRIGLKDEGLSPLSARFVSRLAREAERLPLPLSPPVLACKRLGLPGDFLFAKRLPARARAI